VKLIYLSILFPFALSLPLLPNSLFHSTSLSSGSTWMQMSVRTNPRTLRRHGRASARTQTHPRLCLYNSRLRPSFLLFLSFAFGWSCRICLATPISTCKRRRGHKHFEGDLLAFFAKQKFKGCIYPLDACVFSYVGVYVKIFKQRRRRNRRLFLGICRCHGFFGGCYGPFELH
jgi:hypothetical protein